MKCKNCCEMISILNWKRITSRQLFLCVWNYYYNISIVLLIVSHNGCFCVGYPSFVGSTLSFTTVYYVHNQNAISEKVKLPLKLFWDQMQWLERANEILKWFLYGTFILSKIIPRLYNYWSGGYRFARRRSCLWLLWLYVKETFCRLHVHNIGQQLICYQATELLFSPNHSHCSCPSFCDRFWRGREAISVDYLHFTTFRSRLLLLKIEGVT